MVEARIGGAEKGEDRKKREEWNANILRIQIRIILADPDHPSWKRIRPNNWTILNYFTDKKN
jgi:hypothetical protein